VQLCEVLAENAALTSLSLNRNVIKAEGAVALAGLLRHNNTIKILDLSGNGINDVGGLDMGKALKHNTSLSELYVQNNELAERTGEALLDALMATPSLTQCNVDCNKMPYDMYRKVNEYGRRNRKLFVAGSINRQNELIVKLTKDEVQLEKTESDVRKAIEEDKQLTQRLQSLRDGLDNFYDTERKITKDLETEAKSTSSSRNTSQALEFEAEKRCKNAKEGWETKLKQIQKQIDKIKAGKNETQNKLNDLNRSKKLLIDDPGNEFLDEVVMLKKITKSHQNRQRYYFKQMAGELFALEEFVAQMSKKKGKKK